MFRVFQKSIGFYASNRIVSGDLTDISEELFTKIASEKYSNNSHYTDDEVKNIVDDLIKSLTTEKIVV